MSSVHKLYTKYIINSYLGGGRAPLLNNYLIGETGLEVKLSKFD